MEIQNEQRLVLGMWELYVGTDGCTHLDFNDVRPPKATGWSQVEINYTIPDEVLQKVRTKFHLSRKGSFIEALALRGAKKQERIIRYLANAAPRPYVWMSTDWSE